MLISDFNQVINTFKCLKLPIVSTVYGQPNIILGSYDDLQILRTSVLNQPVPLIETGIYQWLNLNLSPEKELDLSGVVDSRFIPMINGAIKPFYIDLQRELNIKFQRVMEYMNTSPVIYSGDFFSLPEFPEFSEYKAVDGAICVRLDPKICFFLYKGIVPYNKGDSVTYQIYANPMDIGFLVEFTTKRKKASNSDIKTYIKYMYAI